MKFKLLIYLLLTFGLFANNSGAAYIRLPANLNAKPGRLLKIVADTDAKSVLWIMLGDDADLIMIDNKSAIFASPQEGVYKIYAIIAIADVPQEPAICTITVGTTPIPPKPIPPIPPTPIPPTPIPDPIIPLDDFTQSLQDEYTLDTAVDKKAKKQTLIGIYKNGLDVLLHDNTIDTVGKFYNAMVKVSNDLMGNSLQGIRKKLETELNSSLPKLPSTKIDDALKAKITTSFNKIMKSLSVLK